MDNWGHNAFLKAVVMALPLGTAAHLKVNVLQPRSSLLTDIIGLEKCLFQIRIGPSLLGFRFHVVLS